MDFIHNFFYFIVLIGALVFFHELGHFLVAKACKVKVHCFSLGFGTTLFSFQRGETEYRIALLPLGGYVKMLGELPGVEIPEEDLPRALSSKPLWQRFAVVLAGPAFNFILAFIIYFCMFLGNQTFMDTRVGVVSHGDPAWEAGLRPGDKIVEVNGQAVEAWGDLREEIAGRPGESIPMVYERKGQRHATTVLPETHQEENLFKEQESRGRIGISLQYVKPVIAVVDPRSPAAEAGLQSDDVIVGVEGQAIEAWHELRAVLRAIPKGESVSLTVTRDEQERSFVVRPNAAFPPELDRELFSSADTPWGYTGICSKGTVIEEVAEGTPAYQAGLAPGDRLTKIVMNKKDGTFNERLIGVWEIDLAAFHGADARNDFVLTIQRGVEVFSRPLRLLAKEEVDDLKNVSTRYVFGATNDRTVLGSYTFERVIGPGEAVGRALDQVGEDTTLIGTGIAKLVQGTVPMDSMGGPIMLFVFAGKSAEHGIQSFLRMLAIISVNLGLFNLLPVPVLDGGHLMLFLIEGIRRKPPSIRFREITNMVGIAILLLLMVLVFSNDIMRFVLG